MAWPKLRKSQGTEKPAVAAKAAPVPAAEQRLKRLARKLDELPAKDALRILQAQELEGKQEAAGAALHALCSSFVNTLNRMLDNMRLDLTPEVYSSEMLDSHTGLLLQINASGRIVQLAVQSKETQVSTEHFRSPYILRGAVRWFNQELLERQEIQEQQIFFCLDRTGGAWKYFDPRSRKTGDLDRDYLLETMEQLL